MVTTDPTAVASEGLFRTIEELTRLLQSNGKLVVKSQELGSVVVTLTDKALRVHRETQNEGIKRLLQVKRARHDLVLVVEKASVFLDTVNEIVLICSQSKAMRAAIEESQRIASPPQRAADDMRERQHTPPSGIKSSQGSSRSGSWINWIWSWWPRAPSRPAATEGPMRNSDRQPHTLNQHLPDLIQQLKDLMVRAENSYLEFMGDWETARQSCDDAAEICASKAIAARDSRRVTHIVGIPLAALALTMGVLSLVVTTKWEFGFAAVVLGIIVVVITHWLAIDFKAAETSFRSMKGEFHSLLNHADILQENVADVHTKLEGMSTVVNRITFIDVNHVALRDALTRLKAKSDDTCVITTQCINDVRVRKDELRAKHT